MKDLDADDEEYEEKVWTRDDITPEWPTKAQLAKKLGKSITSIVRLTKQGRLNAVVDEKGINRYHPAQVNELLADPTVYTKASDDRREEYAELQLATLQGIIGLVKEPREKIDAIQFRMIEEREKRIKELEAKVEAMWEQVEKARDNNVERQMAIDLAKADTNIKQIAAARMFETIGRLISGNKGVQFTPEQLEQLILANMDGEEKFLTAEQMKEAQRIVAEAKAKTNGKETVKTVVDKMQEQVK